MPLCYRAFGLVVESDVPIPELASLKAPAAADIHVQIENFPPWLGEILRGGTARLWCESAHRTRSGQPLVRMYRLPAGTKDYIWIRYQSGNEFVMDGEAKNIWAVEEESQRPDTASAYLLGPLLALAMRLRGYTCLHASAVAVRGRAVAFMGSPGAGKSTTAATFVAAGYPLVADDMVAFKGDNEVFLVQPTWPGLRLEPDAAGRLPYGAGVLPRPVPGNEKGYLRLESERGLFQEQPLPLGGIYYLSERLREMETPRLESARGRETLMWLIANTYMAYVLGDHDRAGEFNLLGRLATHIPVRRISAPDDPAKIGSLRDLILRDFESYARPINPSPLA